MSGAKPTLPTRVGHAEWGDNHFRGYSVARDLAGHESLTSLLALAIAGRRLGEDERLMLDDLATVISLANPRVWPLKMVRVTSAYGGCNAGMAALTLGLENALLGHHSAGHAAQFLLALSDDPVAHGANHAEVEDGAFEERCRRLLDDDAHAFGFWVPFRPRDERVDTLAERVAARGRSDLPHWRLFVKTADAYWRMNGVRPNIPIAMAAVCLDMHFTPAQIGPLMTAMGAAAFWANAFEGAEQAPTCLQTLPVECVRYVGPAPRSSPRAGGRSK